MSSPDAVADELGAPTRVEPARTAVDLRPHVVTGREQPRLELLGRGRLGRPGTEQRDRGVERGIVVVLRRELHGVPRHRQAGLHLAHDVGEHRLGEPFGPPQLRQLPPPCGVVATRCRRAPGRPARAARVDRARGPGVPATRPPPARHRRARRAGSRAPLMRHHAMSGSGSRAGMTRNASHSSVTHVPRPSSSICRPQLVGERQEVEHVARGVAPGGIGEGTARPVGELLGLVEPLPEHRRHERHERRRTEPDETGGDLRVEQRGRAATAGSLEDREIGRSGVRHHRRRRVEQVAERTHVARQRVDEGDAAGPRNLHEAQPRVVRALGDELGVEAVLGLRPERGDDLAERRVANRPNARRSDSWGRAVRAGAPRNGSPFVHAVASPGRQRRPLPSRRQALATHRHRDARPGAMSVGATALEHPTHRLLDLRPSAPTPARCE